MDSREIAGSITEEEGRKLSMIFLTQSLNGIDDESRASFSDRKLIDCDNGMALSEAARLAISSHPLFGKGKEHGIFPECFFPMLIASGEGKEAEAIASSAFPSLGKAESARLLQPIFNAFEALSIREDPGRAAAFLSLPYTSRIAYILSPSDTIMRERAVSAIELAAGISALDAEEEEEAEDLIRKASGFDRFSFFELENLQVLYRKEGRLYGRKEDRTPFSLVAASDFSVIVQGHCPIAIYMFAEPRKAGIVSEWMITQSSIRKALLSGLSSSDIISMLRQASQETIPVSVESRIASWEELLTSVRGQEAIMLTVSERAERLMNALSDKLEGHIIAHPQQGLFLMRPDTAWQWTGILASIGLDMLGTISLEKEERHISDIELGEIKAARTLPEEREVPFDSARRNALLSSADPYRRALILSGIIYRDDQETPQLKDVVLGLDYQEKKRLIAHSISHSSKVYAEFVGGSVIIAKAERSEKEGYTILNGREIEIAKIWKTALLPISIASITYLCPSDSDNL